MIEIAGIKIGFSQLIREISLDKNACKRIAEILEIDGDGESAGDVVQYAFVEHVKGAGMRGQKIHNDNYEKKAYGK